MSRMLARVAVAVGLVVVSALAWAGPAGAHASQTGSTPKAGAVLPDLLRAYADEWFGHYNYYFVSRTVCGSS